MSRALLKVLVPGLSRQFALWIFFSGLVLSLLMAALSIVVSYSSREAQVRAGVAEIVEKSLPSISTSVYTIDDEQLKIQLDSLLFNPNIQFAQVTEIRAGQKIYTSRGMVPDGYDFIEERPLVYSVAPSLRDDYGQLSVIATFDATYNEMLRRAATVFITNMVLVLLLLVVVAHLLSRNIVTHLHKLSMLHNDLCDDNLSQRFELDRPAVGINRPDELDQLLVSMNISRRQFHANQPPAGETDAQAIAARSIWADESLDMILDTAVARSQVMREPFVLLVFQVNNEFDKRSEHVAEQFLHVVAKRSLGKVLQSRRIASADEDNVRMAPLGHNQFGIVIGKIGNPVHCKSLAERLMALFQEDIMIGARTIKPAVSIGIYMSPRETKSRQSVLVSAEYALNIATKKAPESAFEIYEVER